MSAGRKKKRAPRTPLAGCRVLITRARRQAGALASLLRRKGARVTHIPAIEVRAPRSYAALDRALKNIARYDWLIFTSVNGVEAMWKRMAKRKVRVAALRRLKVAAIGPATKAEVERRGLAVEVMPHEYIAESVVWALRRKVRGKRVLLVRARVARDVIPRELRRAGARVDVVEAYQTELPKGSAVRLKAVLSSGRGRPDYITFTSSSTAQNLVALLGGRAEQLRGVRLASIGPVTSATLRKLGLKPAVEAREYTIPGLVAALVRAATRGRGRP